jgi:nucleoside-diphosphate-sugar epimerase
MLLVTGATGFLGGFVTRALLEHGFEVLGTYRERQRIGIRHPRMQWVRLDLRDERSVRRLPKVDGGIVHLASALSVDYGPVIDVDVLGMARLLERWEAGPFVFCSSVDVYGRPERVPLDEGQPLAPRTWYGWGKVACEEQLRLAARVSGRTDALVFRLPYVLGRHPRFGESLFGRLIERARRGDPSALPVKCRGGRGASSWVAASDAAWCVAEALSSRIGGCYNVASGHACWEAFIGQILQCVGSDREVEFEASDEDAESWVEDRRLSTERLERAFPGFRPMSLDATLSEILADDRYCFRSDSR